MRRRSSRGSGSLAALLPAVAAAVTAVLVAACSGPTTAPAAGGPAPAVTSAQVDRVMSALGAALRTGDAQRSPSALADRVDGEALAVRTATYAVQAKVATTPAPPALTGTRLLTAVPATGAWPRWFLAVTRASSSAVPQLLVLTQASARAQYHLSASASLLPGTTLPTLARSSTGAATSLAPASSTGLSAAPSALLTQYADVLSGGSGSASAFPDDALRKEVAAQETAERTGTAKYDTYAAAYTVRDGSSWVLRTQDGGALVIGVLTGTRTFTPRGAGVTQTLTADLAALAGRSTATGGLRIAEADVVVLQVPAAGSSAKPALVAGARGVTGVQLQ